MKGFVKECISTFMFRFKNKKKREKWQKKKLKALVKYAKENSPYYAKLYADIDTDKDINLADLTPVTKQALMENYEDAVTDRAVRLAEISEFIKDIENCKRLYNGKYMAVMTSGSTGGAMTMLYDTELMNHTIACGSVYTFPTIQELKDFKKRSGLSVTVCQNISFGVANQVNQQNIAGLKHPEKIMTWVHSMDPTEKIAAQLQKLQPGLLNTYPSTIDLIADEQEKGNIDIHPSVIVCSGEGLSDAVRGKATRVFGSRVHANYSCTEGGVMAQECKFNRLHINDDSVILEPVDKDGKPVPYGTTSDKIYITNLRNRIQPIIRYEITDKVTVHDKQCPCGRASRWIEIKGRTAEAIAFETADGIKKLPSFNTYMRIYDLLCLKRFQIVVHPHNNVELRLIPDDGFTKDDAFNECVSSLETYFNDNGVTGVKYRLSDTEPERDSKNMKFRAIYQTTEE